MTLSRWISLIIIGIYLLIFVIAYMNGEFEHESKASIEKSIIAFFGWFGLSLAFIWFGDEIGDYTGWAGHSKITSTTPGCLVAFFGWLLLLFPIVFLVISKLV